MSNICLISNNCIGGELEVITNSRHNSPFVWNLIYAKELIKLFQNFDSIDFNRIDLIRLSRVIEDNNNDVHHNPNYKICGLRIDKLFDVYYTHYRYDAAANTPTKRFYDVYYKRNFEYVVDTYNRRLARMCQKGMQPSFLVVTNVYQGWTKLLVEKLLQIDTKYKLCIITDFDVYTSNPLHKIIHEKALLAPNIKNPPPRIYANKYYVEITNFLIQK